MGADESNINNVICVIDGNDYTVMITTDVKHHTVILDDAAVAYTCRISLGVVQWACCTSWNHALSAASASGWLSQNSRSVFRAIIRT